MASSRYTRLAWLTAAVPLLPAMAHAAGANGYFIQTTFLLILLISLADWCGLLFERLGLPEMLGEISAGILLGNLHLMNIQFDVAEQLRSSDFMQYSSELAMVLLLFLVGLNTNMGSLLKVGRNAVLVALTGVALPLAMGLAVATLIAGYSGLQGWFIGAMLAATSVGITARYLEEKDLLGSPSAQVILGAAVIDDVLGILLLAVLASVAAKGGVSSADLLVIVAKALGFFMGAVIVARTLLPRIVNLTSLSKHSSFWTGFSLCLALIGAQLAALAGLAPLIGAFVAGLLLDDVHFVVKDGLTKHHLEDLLRPIADIMLTIFFVGIGSQVQLETLLHPGTQVLVLALFLVAVVSKGVAGMVARGRQYDRLGIGIGMIPRGEVGLVFASFAFTHHIFDGDTFSALVLVVLLTTMAGPLLLKPRLNSFVRN